jgi:hypothetical protein
MRNTRWATALATAGIAALAGCSGSGAGNHPSARESSGGASRTAVADAAPGGGGATSTRDDGGSSFATAEGTVTPTSTPKASSPAPVGHDSSAFCTDAAKLLATDGSGPPTARNIADWDRVDAEAPAGVEADVHKVDLGLHDIQAGKSLDITGYGVAMQSILQWLGTNCGFSKS